MTFDYGEVGREVGVGVRVADRDGAFERAEPALDPVTIAWTYADNAANDAQPRDRDVDRVVARLFAERAKQEAVALNREGQYDDGRPSARRRPASGSPPTPARTRSSARSRPSCTSRRRPTPRRCRRWRASSVTTRPARRSGMRTPDGKSMRQG